jgi:hypothetical protein
MSRTTRSGGAVLACAAFLLVTGPASAMPSPSAVSPGDPVIAAAGDIACDPGQSNYNDGDGTARACRQKDTANLIAVDPSISAVLALGDEQNDCGGYSAYLQAFGPTWGRFKSMIHPVPGNHEYQTSGGTDCAAGAAGYFRYFGTAAGDSRGDYAWDLGAWHLIALNGNCSAAGGCGSSSPQGRFLKASLGSSACTLAYWHQPYFSGANTGSTSYRYFWRTLYAAGADVVLDGHLHTYARFAPQNPAGAVDPAHGIRQFIVGTGGDNLFNLKGSRNVEYGQKSFGILELTLHPASYDWRFVTTAGVVDSGTAPCR